MGLMENVVGQLAEGSGGIGSGFVKLKLTNPEQARQEINAMLIENEQVIAVFQAMRDQVIFTNARIITIDVKGFTGSRKAYSSMPYKKITEFTVQTTGFIELFPDQELWLTFASGHTVRYDFSDAVDLSTIVKMISNYVCKS